MKKTASRQILIISALILTVLLSTSCPQEVTAPMVALAEDTLVPTITITSPNGGDNYYSSVTVSGFLSDDVQVETDGGGQISSFSYEIANDDFRKGKIDIGLDDQVTADTDFGSGTIDYDTITGEFSFTFSTIEPSELRDLISLSITTVDRNDNTTTETLSLTESEGPYLEFSFYNNADYEVLSKIDTLDGTRVYLGGYVANSNYDVNNAEEISEITWGVIGSSMGGTLNTSEDSDDWVEEDGLFKTVNNIDTTKTFSFDPATRMFKTLTEIDVEDSPKYIYFTATDIYGHSTTVEQLLTEPASLMLFSNTTDNAYYSPKSEAENTEVLLPFKITDPNDKLDADQISEVKCSFSSTDVENTPDDEVVYTYSTEENFNNFFTKTTDSQAVFNVPVTTTSQFAGLTGDIYVTVTVTDYEDNTINKSVLMYRDDVAPVISSYYVDSSGGVDKDGKTYISRGDTVTVYFTAVDDDAGVGDLGVEINGATASTANISGNSYLASAEIDDEATSGDTGDSTTYTIDVKDKAGNIGTTVSAADNDTVFYGPYNELNADKCYSVSSLNTTTSNSITGWARAASSPANDTVTVSFTSSRVLASDPVFTIAGRAVLPDGSVSYTSTSGACSASLQMNGVDELLSEGDEITFNVSFTDIVGNTSSQSGVTGIDYDNTAPLQPSGLSYTGDTSGFINSNDIDDGSISFSVSIPSAGTSTLYVNDGSTDLSLGTTTDTGNVTITADEGSASALKSAMGGDGDKTVFVKTSDTAGNISAPSTTLALTMDTVFDTCIASDDPDKNYNGIDSKTGIFNQDSAAGFSVSDSSGVSIDNISWTVATVSGGTCTYSKNAATGALEIDSFTADGIFTATLTATDNAGNESSDSFEFVIDATPLVATFSGINHDYVNATPITLNSDYSGAESGTPIFVWSATTEPSGGAAIFDDTSAQNTTITPDDDGYFVIQLAVYDQLGRPAVIAISDSGDYDFTRETDLPYFTNSISPMGSVNPAAGFSQLAEATDDTSAVATYQWTVDDDDSSDSWIPSAGAELHINDGDAAEVNLSDGNYTATCDVVDLAGNHSDIDLTFTFIWDETPPAITNVNISPSSGSYLSNGDTVNVTFDVDDDLSSINTPTATIYGKPAAITGGSGSYTASYTFTDDTSIAAGNSVTYIITASDVIASGTDNEGTSQASPYTFYGLYDDTYNTKNITNTTIGGSYIKSGETLEIEYTSTRQLLSTGTSATIHDSSESHSKSADNIVVSGNTCTATFNIDGTEDFDTGVMVYDISFKDAAGNTFSTTSESSGITYDCTAPSEVNACLLDDTDLYINNVEKTAGDVKLTIDYGTSGATTVDNVEIYLDSVAPANLLADTAVTHQVSQDVDIDESKLTDEGITTIIVRIIDAAGNNGAAYSSTPFTVDTEIANPGISGDSAFSAAALLSCSTTYSEAVTYSWSVTGAGTATPDSGSSDSLTITNCNSDGNYTAVLTVTDAALNSENTSHPFIWDSTFSAVLTGTGSGYAKEDFDLTAVDSNCESGIASYSWSVTDSPSGSTPSMSPADTATSTFSSAVNKDGSYTVSCSIENNAGVTLSPIPDVTFIWDTTPPEINPAGTFTGGNGTLDAVMTATVVETNPKTYSWTLESSDTGIHNIDPADWSYADEVLTMTHYFSTVTYTATLTIEDEVDYSDTQAFTFSCTGEKALLLSSLSQTTTSGGGSDSSSGSSSGRINTYNFDEAVTEASEASINAETLNSTAASSSASESPSQAYSGNLYSPPSRTTVDSAAETAELDASESKAGTQTEVERIVFEAPSEGVNITNAEPEAEYAYTDNESVIELDTTFQTAERRTNVGGSISKLSSRASSAAGGRTTVEPATAEIIETSGRFPVLPTVIILLLGGFGAGIIIRKKRL